MNVYGSYCVCVCVVDVLVVDCYVAMNFMLDVASYQEGKVT